jgi:hypothetical protein
VDLHFFAFDLCSFAWNYSLKAKPLKDLPMKCLRRNNVERFDFAGTKMILRNPDFSGLLNEKLLETKTFFVRTQKKPLARLYYFLKYFLFN